MKAFFLTSIKLTIVMIVLCCGVYFGLIYLVGKAVNGTGGGVTISNDERIVGYELIGQKFTGEKYFWGRPSAAEYNAAGSAGSNKGPSNPDYLKIVQDRIDTFMQHHPGVNKKDIPSEMVTASGSGLDPHISPASAKIQVGRIQNARNVNAGSLNRLIDQHTHRPLFGPAVVNVLKLNMALDETNHVK